MKYIITGRNIEVTEGLKSAIYEKIGKLERYFTPDATVYVTLSVQKDRQKIEVTIPVKGFGSCRTGKFGYVCFDRFSRRNH